MNIKTINSTLVGIVAVLLFLAVLVLVKVLFAGSRGFEWGNAADLTSALCNIVIASTALCAAFVANNWFVQNKKLKSLSTSHQLAMKFEMQLWEINSRLYNDGIVRASIRKYVQDNKELTDEIKSKVAAEINKKATSDLSELANLYTTRSMLARFDIKLSERLENLFKDILELRQSYLDNQYIYLLTICKHINCPKHEDVIEATENLESVKRELAAIFQYELCETNIDTDYSFS
ncbi:hypothetical protein [Escherichia coli]|uniref:hypothetical protein n=1 Tax=Escherichia coli TaxID=562 RepID=UPI001CC6DA90|nr:hypothetical protein [Escherichia coli]